MALDNHPELQGVSLEPPSTLDTQAMNIDEGENCNQG